MKAMFLSLLLVTSLNTLPLYAQWVETTIPVSIGVNTILVDGTTIFAGTRNGIFASTDEGTSWTPINVGLTDTIIYSIVSDGVYYFAGTRGRGVFRSSDNGLTWTAVNEGLPELQVSCLAVRGQDLFAATSINGMFISTDRGTSWSSFNSGLPGIAIQSVIVRGPDLFLGGLDGVFRFLQGGTSWVAAGLADSIVWTLVADETNIFAGTWGGGVFRTTNDGEDWMAKNSGLPAMYIFALATKGVNLFAGSAGLARGVFLSTDQGESWSDVSTGLPAGYAVYSLAADSEYLFAGLFFGGGLWRRPLSEMVTTVDERPGSAPTEFRLQQNYPNPFNPSTVIGFELPVSGFVTLKVFDALGREVATLVSETLPAGLHSRQWNADGVAGGVYFYRLQSGAFSETKKLVAIK